MNEKYIHKHKVNLIAITLILVFGDAIRKRKKYLPLYRPALEAGCKFDCLYSV